MNVTVPIQKSIKFFMIMFPAFFALVNPASTMANPACIQNTSAAPIKNQTANTWPFTTLKISSVIFPILLSYYEHLARSSTSLVRM